MLGIKLMHYNFQIQIMQYLTFYEGYLILIDNYGT
jgi:hypothetical protein